MIFIMLVVFICGNFTFVSYATGTPHSLNVFFSSLNYFHLYIFVHLYKHEICMLCFLLNVYFIVVHVSVCSFWRLLLNYNEMAIESVANNTNIIGQQIH